MQQSCLTIRLQLAFGIWCKRFVKFDCEDRRPKLIAVMRFGTLSAGRNRGDIILYTVVVLRKHVGIMKQKRNTCTLIKHLRMIPRASARILIESMLHQANSVLPTTLSLSRLNPSTLPFPLRLPLSSLPFASDSPVKSNSLTSDQLG